MRREGRQVQRSRSLVGMIIGSAVVLFIASSLRHGLFQSNAWDLGIFDQPLYLLSQGLPPISTIIGVHILGDHAAWIFYPLSLLYRIYADVHWLFAVQAVSLALGALPTWHLARQAGLKGPEAHAIAVAYLLYPLIFNLNLFDFHPEVIALPLLLTAILTARANQIGWFSVCIVIILGCRDALSLTVAAMGVWFVFFERRRVCGAIAFLAGLVWFILATQVIIPHYQPAGILGASHYREFGSSIPEILLNLVLRPDILLRSLFTLPNLGYLCFLLAPVAWGLSWRHLTPLVAAIPQLAMNLLSVHLALKDLVHQYSLPILPFLLLSVISAWAAGHTWLQRPRRIVLWSLVGFLALGQFYLFGSRYLSTLDTWQASRAAIAQVTTTGAMLAPAATVPHLSHRQLIHVVANVEGVRLENYAYLLFNLRHPGRMSSPENVIQLIEQARQSPAFQLSYERDGVYLFHQIRVADKSHPVPLMESAS